MTTTETTMPTADIAPGTFFKTNGRWFYAIAPAAPMPSISANAPIYRVMANGTDGHTDYVYVHSAEVITPAPGGMPDAFRPSRMRARAAKLDEQVARLQSNARIMRQFAADMDEVKAGR